MAYEVTCANLHDVSTQGYGSVLDIQHMNEVCAQVAGQVHTVGTAQFLPFTGSNLVWLVAIAAALLLIGVALYRTGRA
jgi:hypothetical protein